jgi:multidrug resistance efflux pump
MWQRAERLAESGAIADEERRVRRFALEQAAAELARVEGELERLEAGAWQLDVEIAAREVAEAEAGLERARTELERSIVRAPLDALVVRTDVRPGEYAQAGSVLVPPVVLAPAGALQVRVQVDEEDASRVRPGARAEGFVRGRERAPVELRFVRIEPRVVPKLSLTGGTTERIDTRVLFVVYELLGNPPRVYAGQKLDVFIEAT